MLAFPMVSRISRMWAFDNVNMFRMAYCFPGNSCACRRSERNKWELAAMAGKWKDAARASNAPDFMIAAFGTIKMSPCCGLRTGCFAVEALWRKENFWMQSSSKFKVCNFRLEVDFEKQFFAFVSDGKNPYVGNFGKILDGLRHVGHRRCFDYDEFCFVFDFGQ